MRRLFHILYLTLFILLTSTGCRCVRGSSSSMERTDTSAIDVRFRSLSQLRDTCAERQTIRIEYQPYVYWALATADTTDTSSIVGIVPPGNIGGGVPAIKSVEIVTERSSGSSMLSNTDSTRLSQSSTKETQQREQSSETRRDNATVAIVAVAAAAVVIIIALTIIKKTLG